MAGIDNMVESHLFSSENFEFPKFTNSLRAFTNLERKYNQSVNSSSNNTINYQEIIIKARDQYRKTNFYEDTSWDYINEVLPDNEKVKKNLEIIYVCSKKLSGNESKELVDSAASYIFHLFLNESMLLQRHLQLLKQLFGSVNSSDVNTAFKAVQDIKSELDDNILIKLSKKHEKKKIFGWDVLFTPNSPEDWEARYKDRYKLRPLNLKSKFSGACEEVNEFSNYLRDGFEDVKRTKFDRSWLINEVRCFMTDCSEGMSTEEYADMILSQLKLKKTNDELQNGLFEILGFDRFDLIQKLLLYRNEIVKADTSSTSFENKGNDFRTPVMQSVTFIDDKDKYSQRLKQDRRIKEDIDKMYSANNFHRDAKLDYEDIKNFEKQNQLKKKASAPVKYPHVYDLKEDVKATPGYIAGVKMLLPEGVKRQFKPLYEEVVIPASEQPPTEVGKKLVEITSLNKIGQMGFEGVKRLNRVQSVVFDAAYHTNENLLICAPTGAGKTNIAFLTVMHEIEQHVENDVIKKDSFKIVYVAPMKALAAEITHNFNKRLSSLGISVKELTGDMQLTKSEILETQMLITTPEKWDVVTRKGTGDVALTKLVKLLIIDEVHLLHGDRGPVVEALVARTLRQVEWSQSMIRIVGLSATLPNYLDVARFLRVNPQIGLFYFDSRFRPVPLKQTFIGVKATKPLQQMNDMDTVCYEKVLEQVQKGHQVMVFVHTRNGTIRTANVLKEHAMKANQLQIFQPDESPKYNLAKKSINRLKNKQVAQLFPFGFSCHHAGMLRADRTIIENYFNDGLIKVLVCTATLAWGVNLPAHAVIIRGTEMYDAKHGSFVDLGILDVLQIFGRAGRPQFDTSGHGIIITSYDKLSHYLSLLTNQFPIESKFVNFLADNLNAEIALGTISNIEEAVEWLSYTFLFVRMKVNPLVYGMTFNDVQEDPSLNSKRQEWIHSVAKALDKARMIRYNERTGDLNITDLGRTASHFYIKYDTVEVFNEMMKTIMTDSEVFNLVANAQEFQQLKVRDDEMDELDQLTRDYCTLEVTGGSENLHGKVNILLQTYLSRGRIDSFSLVSDQSYIIQNAIRIIRGLFDIALRKKQAIMTSRFLLISKMFELQMWSSETPLKQFGVFGGDILGKIESKHLTIERLREMDHREIGALLRNPKYGRMVQDKAFEIPLLKMEAVLQPITRTILRIRLKIRPDFRWNDRVHGKTTEAFWIWIEDPNSNFIYHSEHFLITRRQVLRNEEQELIMTIPICEPLPSQYYVKAVSDKWLGSDMTEPLSFLNLTLPDSHPPHTDLLPLQPLPVSCLEDPELEKLYKFSHFNPIQTQIFHCLYHTDKNVLLGAPTGSGKTIVAEIAMFRVFRVYPNAKVVYIAPLKALVRERMEDWKIRFEKKLRRRVVELTGDVSPDIRAISAADVIVTTPEKWDGISRSWQTRNYVRQVALIVIDEIHLLGEDRGPVLEVIISRTNFISSYTSNRLRVIGLSTALANAKDLADWLGIGQMGLYNFRPSVRPVPLEVHISGFPGKHYCPRMATMNRPTFQAIRQHSPTQPALVFVSSRRQTRLTALDLIAYLAGEDNPKQWLHMKEEEMEQIVDNTKDSNLRLTLAFGIGMHHAGLVERDRKTVEELFLNQKIQVLIATATLAWGVNFPAHLVVIKGTEYYDGKLKRYVDMPITDVLQMMGRAGRPQFDEQGVAVVLVHDIKKNFYKKFLYEPFPVESSLLQVLPDHLNAEIVASTIQTKQEALDYLTWTYFFRRLLKNPVYYQLEGSVEECINEYLSKLIEKALAALEDAFCIEVQLDERTIESTSMGKIASFYYLTHQTMKHFRETLRSDLNLEQLIQALSDAFEFSQLPVRHNEDLMNGDLSKKCPLPVNQYALDSPHTKAQLLFQAHFFGLQLPCVDYFTDLKSVLDQSVRVVQAMIDICAEQGWLAVTLRAQNLMQMIIQGAWIHNSPLLTLPHFEKQHVQMLRRFNANLATLPGLMDQCTKDYNTLARVLREDLMEFQIEEVHKTLSSLPVLSVKLGLRTSNEEVNIPQPMPRDLWIEVPPEQECSLTLSLRLLNKRNENQRAYTPKFPRGSDEGWFLTLGCVEEKELMALKRVPAIRWKVSHQNLTFHTPKRLGRHILTLYIFSDCYLGLDQQYSFNIEVVPEN